jgi:hypothetical protein
MRLFCTNIIVITYPVQECGKQQPSRSKKKKKKEGNYKSANSLKIARREQSQWFGKLKMSVFRGFFIFVGLPPNLET